MPKIPWFKKHKTIVINGKGHLLGRMAAHVAKALLNGQKVVVVGCEQVNISGTFFRAKLKYRSFLRKRCNVNPARGPFHHRAPREIVRRTIRGMMPHRTRRGELAFHHLKCYEGIPPRYASMKLQCVPKALRVLWLRPDRKYCHVGHLSHEVGWKYQHVIKALEAKRKVKQEMKSLKQRRLKVLGDEAKKKVGDKVKPFNDVIASLGYHVY